jgi:hypothetical protein
MPSSVPTTSPKRTKSIYTKLDYRIKNTRHQNLYASRLLRLLYDSLYKRESQDKAYTGIILSKPKDFTSDEYTPFYIQIPTKLAVIGI